MPCRSAGDPTGARDSQDDVIEIVLLALDEFSLDMWKGIRIEKPLSHKKNGKTDRKSIKILLSKLFKLKPVCSSFADKPASCFTHHLLL
jgi:hypothetical protein